MNEYSIYDVTLRDGNHALRHKLTSKFVAEYCRLADDSGVWAVEVGHGNGLGASSFLVGQSAESDHELLIAAKDELRNAKLAVHAIPGFATLNRDIKPAIELGVEVFRIATHVTEASVAEKHIEYLANSNVTVNGVLMMSHMIDLPGLIAQVKLMKNYGASAVILMDSAGYFLPQDVRDRIAAVKNEVEIELGFHAHNNLGVAVTNANAAIEAGASVIDGATSGLGAGAGNAQLEAIIATQSRLANFKFETKKFLALSRHVTSSFAENLPRITPSSIESGLAGVFSGYSPQVSKMAEEIGVDTSILWEALAQRKLVAGQESMIREIAQDLMNL